MALKSDIATEAELAEVCQKIGALILAASHLDIFISQLIAAMTEMAKNSVADMLIHSIDLSRKRQIIESYCSMFDGHGVGAPIDRLAKFSRDLGPVIDDRNTAAHGQLTRREGKLCVTGYSAVRRFRNAGKELRDEHPTHISIDSFDSKIDRCSRLQDEAVLLTRVFAALHARSKINGDSRP
jgi:hypothetical protein